MLYSPMKPLNGSICFINSPVRNFYPNLENMFYSGGDHLHFIVVFLSPWKTDDENGMVRGNAYGSCKRHGLCVTMTQMLLGDWNFA